jgi:hypothetical protein
MDSQGIHEGIDRRVLPVAHAHPGSVLGVVVDRSQQVMAQHGSTQGDISLPESTKRAAPGPPRRAGPPPSRRSPDADDVGQGVARTSWSGHVPCEPPMGDRATGACHRATRTICVVSFVATNTEKERGSIMSTMSSRLSLRYLLALPAIAALLLLGGLSPARVQARALGQTAPPVPAAPAPASAGTGLPAETALPARPPRRRSPRT